MANATVKTVWKPEFTPKRAGRGAKDYEAAFYGFVRQHHARNSV